MAVSREEIFRVEKVNKSFASVHVLKDLDFGVRAGEIHGLVGHNGAGKSTLMKVLAGSYIPESGELFLDGKQLKFHNPKDAIDQGIGMVSQEGSLVYSSTGLENIFLGHETLKGPLVDNRAMQKRGEELLREMKLNIKLSLLVSELSPAQRKLIEILKILSHDPKIVILDEPTAPLSEKERVTLFELMRHLRDRGHGIIFITHYIDEVIHMCDRITVMRDGMVVDTLDGETATKQEIIKLMINRDQETEYTEKHAEIGEVVLDVKNLEEGEYVKNASFNVRAGEVVGLFGTVGSGRSEACETVFGARKKRGGTIEINGAPVTYKTVYGAIKAGVAMIPEDRLRKALLLDDSIEENLSLPYLRDYATASFINQKAIRREAQKTVDTLGVRTSGIGQKVADLSGGNKQKISFGRWFMKHRVKTRLFIFDEPTEGVDVGARAEMYKIIVELAEQGCGCLVVSSDITEIMGLCDRVFILHEGTTVAEINCSEEPNLQHAIIAASIG